MDRIHFLLDILESELLRILRWPDDGTLQSLKALNSQMADLVHVSEWYEIVELNHEFDRVLWNLSTRNLISDTVQRIWPLTDAYVAGGYRLPEIARSPSSSMTDHCGDRSA